jgi:hypothetical protein
MHTLLAAGADINLHCGQWGTALQAAIECGSKETAMELRERGADVNAKAGYWGTSLMQAAYKGDEGLFHTLLDRGADVNIQHGRYGNALQVAITGNTTIWPTNCWTEAQIRMPKGDIRQP